MIVVPFSNLSMIDKKILRQTLKRTRNSLNKNTNPQVSVTVVTDKKQYFGNNVFLSNCTLFCAEMAGILGAVTNADLNIRRIYLASRRSNGTRSDILTPCGHCRQIIVDFSILCHRTIHMLSTNDIMEEVLMFDSNDLLMNPFRASVLNAISTEA